MAKSKTYTVPYKRKEKTNYRKRLSYLSSKKIRIVVRTSSNKTIIQSIEFTPKGDKTLTVVNSLDLKKYGWSHHLGNSASGYLTGLLFAKKSKLKTGTLDFGFKSVTKKARNASIIKGIVDGGIQFKYNEEIFPNEEEFIKKYKDFESTKNKITKENG